MRPLLISLLLSIPELSAAQSWLRIDSVFSPSGVIAQSFSAPEFADFDDDGDLDLLMGNTSTSRVAYFRNVGPSTLPQFVQDTSLLSSIYSGGTVGTNSYYPAATDIDNDGDFDLVIAGFNGLRFYANVGDSVTSLWLRVDSLFTNVNTLIGTDAKPAFGDLDGDGDPDLLIGIGESLFGGPTPGITMGFRNTGSPTTPYYVQDNSLVTGIPDIGLNSYPTLRDLDNDGDLDLLLGRDLTGLIYYRNTGTAASPIWTNTPALVSGVETTTYWKNPTFSDFDDDGDFDLTYGTADGRLHFYRNIGTPALPQLQYDPSVFQVVRINGGGSTISLADFDHDGDLDMVSGDWLGGFQYFQNQGSASSPRFRAATATFSSLDPGSYSSPTFVHLNGDTLLDIVSGALDGRLFCYINTGTGFTQNTTLLSTVDVGWMSAPAFVDIDNDGDLDLLVGAEDAPLMQFFVNQGSNVFVADNSPISGVTSVRDGHPYFVDLDRDGDYDLLIGGSNGRLLFYENTGSPSVPAWTRNDALVAEVTVRQNAAPGCADLDGNGKADIVLGEYTGNFTFFKNQLPTSVGQGEERLPASFTLLPNYPNPFNPGTTIGYTIPSSQKVTLKIFDVLGREIATLIDGLQTGGYHDVYFDAGDLAGGLYFYRLSGETTDQTRTLLLLK